MKNTLKILVVAMILCLSLNSFAQATFGVKAGLNLTNIVEKDDDAKSNLPKVKAGLNFGPTIEIPVSKMFSFESALLLSTRGAKFDSDNEAGSLNLLYLNLPLTAKAKFDISGTPVFGTFGPYLGYGISGKYKVDGRDDETINWGSGDDDDLKPFDAGLHLGAGVGIKTFEVELTYDLGMANFAIYTNRCFAISLGYKFGKK
jgi:Outer membrane protein beta-barrel domain